MSSRSPHSSPHSSNDNYSTSSSVSSTRSIIKPTTPASTSPTSRNVAFVEDEHRGGSQGAGWKITSSEITSDNEQEIHAPMRYPPRVAADISEVKALAQDSSYDNLRAEEAIVLGCTQFIKTGECAYGDACKYSHVSLVVHSDSSTKSRSSGTKYSQNAAADADADAGSARDLTDYEAASEKAQRAINHQLRKTKMCHAFHKGKCDYGYACRFAHIAGHDAYQILSKANSVKNCPFQLVLGTCSTKGKGCYFKHTPTKRINVKGKISKNTAPKAYLPRTGVCVEEGQITSSGSRSGSGGSEEEDEGFEREINDLVDLGEGLRDVYVSRE